MDHHVRIVGNFCVISNVTFGFVCKYCHHNFSLVLFLLCMCFASKGGDEICKQLLTHSLHII